MIRNICSIPIDRKYSEKFYLLPEKTNLNFDNYCIQIPSGSQQWNTKPEFIKICTIKNEIEILNSLQKPRKITIIGSDGNIYAFLCKPNDDLRKDCRFIEFCNLIRRYINIRNIEQRNFLLI